MLTPIDWSIVDRSQVADEQLRAPNVVGSYTLSMVICYNKKKWPGDHHPKSWADFWDVEKFPGRRGVRRTPPIWTIDAALLADGVKEENFIRSTSTVPSGRWTASSLTSRSGGPTTLRHSN